MPSIDNANVVINNIILTEQTDAPTTPPSGKWRIYAKADGLYVVDDAGTETGPFGTGGGGGSGASYPADGRLTLATGTPVTVTDQTAKTTLYYTPYTGDTIALYSGSEWEYITFAELSIAVPNTADTMYDVFVYNDSATAALELTAWTNTTTRATALTRQNGVLVKTGALTRRYVGSVCTSATAGQTEDSATTRLVWNMYNRVRRGLKVIEATSSWTFNASNTWRSLNNSAANRFGIVRGLDEDAIQVRVLVNCSAAANGNVAGVGIGIDSTSANSADSNSPNFRSDVQIATAVFDNTLAAGYHYIQALEYSYSGTQTFKGSNEPGAEYEKNGMIGSFLA